MKTATPTRQSRRAKAQIGSEPPSHTAVADRNPREILAIACAEHERWVSDLTEWLITERDIQKSDAIGIAGHCAAHSGAMLDQLADILGLDDYARGDAIRRGHDLLMRSAPALAGASR